MTEKAGNETLEDVGNPTTKTETATTTPGTQAVMEFDAGIERRVRHKFDRNIIPLVFCMYLLSFLDRSNIGNAETAGMNKTLGFDDAHYQWLLTLFYIPYILFEWLAFMWKVVPPHMWATITIVVWGLAATLQAGAFNWSGLMVCRFFLAIAEAGFGPGIPYLLSFFYKRHELGLRCGIFLAAAPLATTFSGALAYGITSGSPGIANWRVLFLVEGLPNFVMAVFVWYFLPDSPDTAKFLSPEEKEVARARTIQQSGQEGKDRVGSVNWAEAFAAFKNPQTIILPLMYFSCNVSFSSLPVFLPTILKGMGYSSVNAQGLTAPPYFLSFFICIFSTWIADRTQQRGLMIAGLSLVGCVGYILLAAAQSVGARYFGVFLAAAGIFPAISNILPWVMNNQGTDSKRGMGITMLQMIGQCGPILGTRIFPSAQGPRYTKGMTICAAFMFFNAFLALSLRQYYVVQNNRRDKLEKKEAESSGGVLAPAGPTELETSVGYRYVL